MSQATNYNIQPADGISGTAIMTAVNARLLALATNNSGAGDPATMYAYMFKADTTAGLQKQRNAGNTAWVPLWNLAAGFAVGGGANAVPMCDATGNLTIGTGAAVGALTVINNSAAQPSGFFSNTAAGSTATPSAYFRKFDNVNTTSQIYIAFQFNNGTGAGGIQGNGATGVQFFSTSDRRLKENIEDLDGQLSNILALQPRKFDFIDGPKNCVGFIAQEMEEIYPDAVGCDDEGHKIIGGISIMEARLIKAIQEQQAMIVSLQQQLAALKDE